MKKRAHRVNATTSGLVLSHVVNTGLPLQRRTSLCLSEKKSVTVTARERYDAQRIEQKWFDRWQSDPRFMLPRPTPPSLSITCLRCFPILRARCTWDTCATTRSAMRLRATCDERVQRVASDGIGIRSGCRRECGDQEQHAAEGWTLSNIAAMKDADKPSGLRLRLVARSDDLPPEYYPDGMQWFFAEEMYEHGLRIGRRARSTGVRNAALSANEQVDQRQLLAA